MTRRRWLVAALLGVLAAAAIGWTLLAPRTTAGRSSTARTSPGEPSRGGSLVATLRTEPKTFNRYTGIGFPTHLIATLTQARLVRINSATSELEPWLAERWTVSDDGRTYTLELRQGVRFSDGAPFTAADVLFSFAAAYDPKTASPLGESLRVKGKPLALRAVSPSSVTLTFPEPYGPGLRMLDNLPIYPQHRLARALADGNFGAAWGPQTPPGGMAGLGPFVLTDYDPGQRLAFARNPHYWRRDAAGRPLPFLDRLTLEIVPDQNAELLRMQTGGLDVMQGEMRPEDYLPLKREADAGRLRVLDVGASLGQHLLWFNLGTPRRASGWLRAPEFRQALSSAVDRNAFARTVYLGAATPSWGVISPANRTWFSEALERPAYDPGRARTLLAGIGLTDTANSGGLKDGSGRPVQFTVLVQKGIAESEKGASFLREAFARVGVRMDVVALDPATMQGHWTRGDYDALYHHLAFTDTDPAGNLDFWLSSGSAHLWHPGQRTPATEWEARIDELMTRQASAADRSERQRMFADVQRILSEQVPALSFATPHVFVSTSSRVTGGRAAVVRPQLLWDADEISVRAAP